mmetsp:Transcript_164312/g.522565  ORF Transcript_164312/g.522565 Transcript_164312/m.522565 type:complete len:241 (+) Transcript_164312:308-1030(+)
MHISRIHHVGANEGSVRRTHDVLGNRDRTRDASHDHGAATLRAGTAVHGRILVVAQVRLQALQMGDRDCGNLRPGLLLVLLEGVAGQNAQAMVSPIASDEVHEGIADVAHAAGVDRGVEEVEGPCEAQRLQLADQLALRVTVRDVADHHRGGWRLQHSLGELLREVLALGDVCVLEDAWGAVVPVRPLVGRAAHLGAAVRAPPLQGIPLPVLCLLLVLSGVPILGGHGADGAVRVHRLQA